jgi:hypothetical protein
VLLDLQLLELLHHLLVVTEGHVRIQSEHGRLRTLILGLAGTPATCEDGRGRVLLKEVVDVILVLVLLSVLLECLRLLLYILHTLVEGVLWAHFRKLGHLGRVGQW